VTAVRVVAVVGLLVLCLAALWLAFAVMHAAMQDRRRQRVRSAVDEFYRNQAVRSQTDELAVYRTQRATELAGARRRHPTGRADR
jgi:fumarate reductase subunit D